MGIQEWLKAEGWSAARLARALSVSRAAVSACLTGKSRPSGEMLAKIQRITYGEVTAVDWYPQPGDSPVDARSTQDRGVEVKRG